MSHKLQEGREEPVKRTLQGTVNGAWRFLWGRLTLHGCDGPYKVLHYKILRRSRTNEHRHVGQEYSGCDAVLSMIAISRSMSRFR